MHTQKIMRSQLTRGERERENQNINLKLRMRKKNHHNNGKIQWKCELIAPQCLIHLLHFLTHRVCVCSNVCHFAINTDEYTYLFYHQNNNVYNVHVCAFTTN